MSSFLPAFFQVSGNYLFLCLWEPTLSTFGVAEVREGVYTSQHLGRRVNFAEHRAEKGSIGDVFKQEGFDLQNHVRTQPHPGMPREECITQANGTQLMVKCERRGSKHDQQSHKPNIRTPSYPPSLPLSFSLSGAYTRLCCTGGRRESG